MERKISLILLPITKQMLFMSTSGTVGCFAHGWEWADEQSLSETAAIGDWPYYRSKQVAEEEAQVLAAEK